MRNSLPLWSAPWKDWSPCMPEPKNKENIIQQLRAGREYRGAYKIDGPLVFVRKTHPVGYRELIECIDAEGKIRLGMVDRKSVV